MLRNRLRTTGLLAFVMSAIAATLALDVGQSQPRSTIQQLTIEQTPSGADHHWIVRPVWPWCSVSKR